MALKKITGTGRTGSRGPVLHRRPRRFRDWIPKDLSESKSHVEDFLHVLHDAPVCGPLPAPPSTSQHVIQGTKRGLALPPPPEFPQRWGLALKAPDPNSIAVARQMVKIGGSATEEDREAVIQHLAVFPPELLEFARKRLKTNLIACRNSVTDVKVEYRGLHPHPDPPAGEGEKAPRQVH